MKYVKELGVFIRQIESVKRNNKIGKVDFFNLEMMQQSMMEMQNELGEIFKTKNPQLSKNKKCEDCIKVWKVHEFYSENSLGDFSKSENWVAFDDVEQAFDYMETEKENDIHMEFNYRVERTTMSILEFNNLAEVGNY